MIKTSNIDEYGWSALPDDVDGKAHAQRVRDAVDASREPTPIPDFSSAEEALVQKWLSWGFSWRDVAENLENHRAKETR